MIYKIKNKNVHLNNYFMMNKMIYAKIVSIILINKLKSVKINHVILYQIII